MHFPPTSSTFWIETYFFCLFASSPHVERLIVVAEHYESSLSDFQKQSKAARWDFSY